jgi:cytoskeletal protein CcmA (bactofilin family)
MLGSSSGNPPKIIAGTPPPRFISRSTQRAVSSVVEHLPDTEGVTGSNPVSRTTFLARMPIFVTKNGQTFGPHETAELEAFVAAGHFSPEDFCWQEGWAEWRTISSLEKSTPAVAPAEPPANGHIPSDIEIIGTLKLPGERTVTCRVEGEIISPSTVIIPQDNHVKARIKAESVVIFGKVDGDIHATGRTVLKSSSVLRGDIHAARVLVEEGAAFSGKSHVSPQGTARTKGSGSAKKSPASESASPTKERKPE